MWKRLTGRQTIPSMYGLLELVSTSFHVVWDGANLVEDGDLETNNLAVYQACMLLEGPPGVRGTLATTGVVVQPPIHPTLRDAANGGSVF